MYAVLHASKVQPMKRGDARELAVHLIYGREFTGEEPEKVVSVRLDKEYYSQLKEENEIYGERPSRAQLSYIDMVVSGVKEHAQEIDAEISACLRGWTLQRLSRVDLAILRLAVFEMQHMSLPAPVAINEAVELTRKYSQEESCSFVNGVLGTISRKLSAKA